MAARVICIDVRRKLREVSRKLQVSIGEGAYLKALSEKMNLIFGNSPESTAYWNKHVRRKIFEKFCHHLGPIDGETLQLYPMFSRSISFKVATMSFVFKSGMIPLQALFMRMHQILGFGVKSTIENQLQSPEIFSRICCKLSPFRQTDFEELGIRVKHMNLVSYAKGFLFLNQGLDARATDPKTAIRYLSLSIKNFEDSLAANTSSKTTLRACAKALFYYDEESRRAQFLKSATKAVEPVSLETSPRLARADLYFRRAIVADPSDPESLCQYATFLGRLGQSEQSEMFFNRAMAVDKSHVETLKGYGDLLSDQGRFQESEVLYLLAREASRVKVE
jgi:hypothetical protein